MNKLVLRAFLGILAAYSSCAHSAYSEPVSAVADGSLHLEFPRDHGAHPNFGTEWWYYTGHLTSEDARKFGFELTFFRVLVDDNAKQSRSQWASQSLYLAHFTITDDAAQKFYSSDAISRESFGEAGSSISALDVQLGSWSAKMNADQSIQLAANSEDQSLALNLKSKKPVILQGDNGFSKKGPNPGDASYYSSLSRLTGGGTIAVGKNSFKITDALVWMDHEFMSSHKNSTATGWDWFAIQLHDGTELMLYELHTKDRTKGEFSSGSFIDRDGTKTPLNPADFEVGTLGSWKSPKTNITYPSGWRVKVPSRHVDLIVTPTIKDQELVTVATTGITYWEGRNSVKNSGDTGAEIGNAYVELVGYQAKSDAQPLDH